MPHLCSIIRRPAAALAALTLGFTVTLVPLRSAEVYRWDFRQGVVDAVSGLTATLGNQAGLTADGYTFTDLGEGVTVAQTGPTVVTDTYTIFMVFSLTANDSSYQRLIDFKDKDMDQGFYVRDAFFYFYNNGPRIEGVHFVPDQRLVVALRRDGVSKVISCIVNGVFRWSFVDSADEGVFSEADNLMRFFEDDSSEHPAGTVTKIRIYNHVLTSEVTYNQQIAAQNRLLKKAKKAENKRKQRQIKRRIAVINSQKAALLNP